MSETKTKNLCTVPAADLTDSQYFIAEDGGELKRIPKAQVVLKKLENMLATDTENLAGGGEVTAQELLDVLAEQVANKLLAKSQVVNNLLATVEGNPLDATQGKALKDLIDTTNNNLSKAAIKSDLFSSESITNPNTCTVPFSLVNGWHSAITNVPDAAKGKYSILLNIWEYGPSSTGNLTSNHMQALIIEKGGGIFTRLYINSAWSDWA